MDISNQYKRNLYIASLVLLTVLSVYFAVGIFYEVRNEGSSVKNVQNMITVSGTGEVSAAPDVATVYFTLTSKDKTVEAAQQQVAQVEQKALESLLANGVEDKDFKTTNSSFNPVYEYVYSSLECNEFGCPPREGKRTLSGYEARETIQVKIRQIDNTAKIIEDLGSAGVSNLSGPNFEIDDKDSLRAEARKQAIQDAKQKARELARDLDVRLGSIFSFYESLEPNYPLMRGAFEFDEMAASVSQKAEMPKGENTITSNVNITYEIY